MPQTESPAFLSRVARHYYENHGQEIAHLRFVFPSKRALLFFSKALSELAQAPIFLPRCEVISDFLTSLYPESTLVDRTTQLFELYATYRTLRGEHVESFDKFVFWGNLILRDFDLIDRHLIDPRDLFNNLEAYKEMQDDLQHLDDETLELIASFWKSFENPKLKSEAEQEDYRKNFMDFWLSLLPLYKAFVARLEEQGWLYEGQLYRRIAVDSVELADELSQGHNRAHPSFVFVGLFDITPSEMKLFKAMRRRGIAEFYWDEEVAIVQDEAHPAHRILANNISELGRANPRVSAEPQDFLPKDILRYSCASTVSQIKALPTLLTNLGLELEEEQQEEVNTAIILPNEQLLIPVVGSIPPSYKHLNVTLGYPLYRTPIAILLNRWVRLMLYVGSSERPAYPIDQLVSVLSMQLLRDFFPGVEHLLNRLQKLNRYMLSAKWITEKFLPKICENLAQAQEHAVQAQELQEALPILELLLTPQPEGLSLLKALQEILDTLGQRMLEQLESTEEDEEIRMSFDLEFVYHYKRLVQQLLSLMQRFPEWSMTGETIVGLLEGLARTINIPFQGDPLRGLQIMGLLESRLLHFETIIYLSAQEGSLPRKQVLSTLIPATLRKGFSLPMSSDLDAAEAYRFYQSIAHCQKLVMLYGIDEPLGGKGEESRYIAQLEIIYNMPIQRHSIEYLLAPNRAIRKISIDKHQGAIQELLAQYLHQGEDARSLSASSIAIYKQCSLRFYYQELLQIREPQSNSANLLMPANDFGTILHNTMEVIYAGKEKQGGEITQAYLDHLLKANGHAVESVVKQQYRQLYSLEGEEEQQIDTLAEYFISLIVSYVKAILRYDRANTPFTYLQGEVKMLMQLPLPSEQAVNIVGTIDRVDMIRNEYGEHIRVLDYKTGRDEIELRPIPDLWKSFGKFKAILQTLLYCELLSTGKPARKYSPLLKSLTQSTPLVPGLILLRKLIRDAESYSPYIFETKGGELIPYSALREEYVTSLQEELAQIFDLSIPFEQTSTLTNCTYCPFKQICGR